MQQPSTTFHSEDCKHQCSALQEPSSVFIYHEIWNRVTICQISHSISARSLHWLIHQQQKGGNAGSRKHLIHPMNQCDRDLCYLIQQKLTHTHTKKKKQARIKQTHGHIPRSQKNLSDRAQNHRTVSAERGL